MERDAGTILVVEDEKKISEGIKAYLEKENYFVLTAFDGEEAEKLFDSGSPDLVILDLMLPKISGEEVCRYIRKKARTPIIMLTAKSTEHDKLEGFGTGADDYVTKPFSPKELVVRVGSLLRRSSSDKAPLFSKMSWNDGDLQIDFGIDTVMKKGEVLKLTPNEFKLLKVLLGSPTKIFTRDELIVTAFGFDYDGFERTIDVHIKNLRSKLETDTANPQYILTVRGVGYQFGGAKHEDKS